MVGLVFGTVPQQVNAAQSNPATLAQNQAGTGQGANNGNANKVSGNTEVVTIGDADADAEWAELEILFKGNGGGLAKGKASGNNQIEAPVSIAEGFKNQAAQAKAFRGRISNSHPRAAQARSWEAKARLQAVLVGDDAELAEAELLADQVMNDPLLNETERYEVANLAELSKLKGQTGNGRNQVNAKAASARRLINKFPDQVGGFSKLLGLADGDAEDDVALALAAELISGNAPEGIKRAARAVQGRLNLKGTSFPKLVRSILGSSSIFEKWQGEVIVIYTWASWSPGSINQARELMRLAPFEPGLVGLNLDETRDAATPYLGPRGVPGEQLFSANIDGGVLAQTLAVGTSFPIYIIDREGKVQHVEKDISGITEKVGRLSKK